MLKSFLPIAASCPAAVQALPPRSGRSQKRGSLACSLKWQPRTEYNVKAAVNMAEVAGMKHYRKRTEFFVRTLPSVRFLCKLLRLPYPTDTDHRQIDTVAATGLKRSCRFQSLANTEKSGTRPPDSNPALEILRHRGFRSNRPFVSSPSSLTANLYNYDIQLLAISNTRLCQSGAFQPATGLSNAQFPQI